MRQSNHRQKLIASTFRTVAEFGIENATSKRISTNAGVNEAILFRFFESKENLLNQAFVCVGDELYVIVHDALEIFDDHTLNYETQCRLLFARCWEYLLKNADKCRYYLRFYHSSYYAEHVKNRAESGTLGFFDRILPCMPNLPNTEATKILLLQLLDSALAFAVRVIDGELSDRSFAAEQVFRMLFNMVCEHERQLRKEKVCV